MIDRIGLTGYFGEVTWGLGGLLTRADEQIRARQKQRPIRS